MQQSFHYKYRIAKSEELDHQLYLHLDTFDSTSDKKAINRGFLIVLGLSLLLVLLGFFGSYPLLYGFAFLIAVFGFLSFGLRHNNILIEQSSDYLLIVERFGFLIKKRHKINRERLDFFFINDQYQLVAKNQFLEMILIQNNWTIANREVDGKVFVNMNHAPDSLKVIAELLNQYWNLKIPPAQVLKQDKFLTDLKVDSLAHQQLIQHDFMEDLQYFKLAHKKRAKKLRQYILGSFVFFIFELPLIFGLIFKPEESNTFGTYLILALLLLLQIVLILAGGLLKTTKIIQSSKGLIIQKNSFLGLYKKKERYRKDQIESLHLNNQGDLIILNNGKTEEVLLKQGYNEMGDERIPQYNYAPKTMVFIKEQLNDFWEMEGE